MLVTPSIPMYAVAITTQSDEVNVPLNKPAQAIRKTNNLREIHLLINISNCSLLNYIT